jgi:uncharacterized protein YjbI with pentapeptide repeats
MDRKVQGLGALIAVGLCCRSVVHALDQQDLQRLQRSNACEGCDLSGAELAGWRLASVDLIGADLNGADLRAAVLVNVDLSNANLRDTDLSGALVQQTSLRGADLTGASMSGTVFIGADLTFATGLTRVQLDQACDDQRANLTQLPTPFSLRPCE